MPRSDRPRTAADWRSWLALAWAVVTGTLYARMVLQERAPAAWEALCRVVDPRG